MRKRRQEEERKLEEQRGHLIQERHNLEEQKKALEAKLFEVEELIPSAKQLKNIGIGFDQAFVWIDCIRERRLTKNELTLERQRGNWPKISDHIKSLVLWKRQFNRQCSNLLY